ncbi:MAG: signal peptide peptidase SppA [Gammaproteobacteria bacterium]|nr:signal peptide peptidase SppA [Gammaproteobacteria bacterium]NNF48543.1 signal peptide peptidase SppA [Woeseiaceae bacterium]NNL63687.1 signal peptide peptidase SppA [Woeseiaceae bacterium]
MSSSNVFVRFFRAVWRGLNALRKFLHLILLLIIFMLFFGVMSGEAPPILPKSAALVVQPAGALVEQLSGDPYERAIAELTGDAQPETLVQDVVDALEAAGDDDRISAVHLELSSVTSGGMDKLRRVAAAIDTFQESGKPVIATADFYTQQAYYLAAHADEVYLNPDGVVFIQGYGSYRDYYKDAIELLRIDWNVFKVGTHKSFVEPYTRTDMSPEDREFRARITRHLWESYDEHIVAARGLAEGAVDDYTQNLVAHTEAAGGDLAIAARDRGLVDDLLGRTAIRELFIERVGVDEDDESTYAKVGLGDYLAQLRLRGADDKSNSENVGVIIASGNILDGTQPPGTIGGDSTAALLRRALEDEAVKAVVLRVDSGGGSAFASEVIAEEIRELQEAGKPVVASMGSVAASGGYWISMFADKIYASPTTITGSIGILGMFPTFQRTLAAVGIYNDGVGTTPWSGQLRPDREMNDETKALFQAVINDGYQDFITGVAEGRELEVEYVDQIGQGKVWTGEEALSNGLVDELGGLKMAIEGAAELAGLESYGQVLLEQELSPTEQLILDLLYVGKGVGIDPVAFTSSPTLVERFANRFEALLANVARFNDPMGVYAYCFCEIE